MQRCRIFHGTSDPLLRPCPSEDDRREMVDRDNPKSPFSRFVGNAGAVEKLQVVAFDALGKEDHLCRDLAFSLFGPASSGKTSLAKLFAEVVGLPFLELGPKQITTLDDIFQEVSRKLKVEGVPLVEFTDRNYFLLPPMVIFIDEVHALSGHVVDGLLKATEYNDATLVTESGRTLNCYNVCWMCATTDEGKLFDAFRSRFSPVNLKYLNNKEISKIIKLNYPDLEEDVCDLIAHYNSLVPRTALQFARYFLMSRGYYGDISDLELIKVIANKEGIDDYGMRLVHLKVLTALGKNPISKNRMVNVTGRKREENDNYIMPWLLTETEDRPALVTVTGKGYTITDAGMLELKKRGIAYDRVLALGGKHV
jgi:Holliday junction resolvasome RuvABC ATP-dependent DNA helicase subunit